MANCRSLLPSLRFGVCGTRHVPPRVREADVPGAIAESWGSKIRLWPQVCLDAKEEVNA